jgi:hypothetical protein
MAGSGRAKLRLSRGLHAIMPYQFPIYLTAAVWNLHFTHRPLFVPAAEEVAGPKGKDLSR